MALLLGTCAVIALTTVLCFASPENYVILLKAEGFKVSSSRLASLRSNIRESRAYFRRTISLHHDSLIESVLKREASDVKIQSYSDVVSGFAARLTEAEAAKLKRHAEVYSVTKDTLFRVATTRSYTFLGLDSSTVGAWKKTTGTDVVIGVLDTGVWPEDPSFNDAGFGPPPAKFIGACQTGENFTTKSCNKRLVGARYFGNGYASYFGVKITNLPDICNEYVSPRDAQGHGSHTSSTAGGAVVSGAKLVGQSIGTAKGVAYGARVAAYKVLWCNYPDYSFGVSSDIIAAVDAAVGDGVDVISGSFGGFPPTFGATANDAVAFVMHYATISGVAVVMSAGNSGPDLYTVSNSAPWIFSIGASTIDRKFVNKVVLGSGASYHGVSVSNAGTPQSATRKFFEVIASENAAPVNVPPLYAFLCFPDSLNSTKVKGKIVLCQRGTSSRVEKGLVVKKAGGVGMIEVNQESTGNDTVADIHYLPATAIGHVDGLAVRAYIEATKKPVAYITATEIQVGKAAVVAPEVAGFSSLGPNGASLNILKPDVIAPGVAIFAAWSQSPKKAGGVTASPLPDGSPSAWNIISGTSMACPHVSGVVALLKAYHPSWKASMIFSAIATTAQQNNNQGRKIQAAGVDANPFYAGSGHLDPNKAIDPGLVYRISNYDAFLCSPDFGVAAGDFYSFYCPSPMRAIDLNLPSITFYNVTKSAITYRTLTNVGPAGRYYVSVEQPSGAKLIVTPTKMDFVKGGSRKFYVRVNGTIISSKAPNRFTSIGTSTSTVNVTVSWVFGSVVWYNTKGHRVRIPIVANIAKL